MFLESNWKDLIGNNLKSCSLLFQIKRHLGYVFNYLLIFHAYLLHYNKLNYRCDLKISTTFMYIFTSNPYNVI